MVDIVGTSAGDRLTGGDGDDRFEGLAGNDTIKGRGGVDVAVFSGNLNEYSWTATNRGWDITGPDGTDSLEDIEILEFDDYTFSLTGDNDPVAYFPTVETDVDTPIEFQISGYDLDDEIFSVSLSGSPVYQQRLITQVSFSNTVTADGRASVVTYLLDPTRIPDSIAEPLAEGEAMVVPLTVTYGSIHQGFQDFDVEVLIYGKNDAPTMYGGTVYAVEDGGPALFDLSTVADDPDSDDSGTSLTYEIVDAPEGLDVSIDGTNLVFDPLDGYQILVPGQFVEETIQVRAIDRYSATSETVEFVLSVEGANDPQPDSRYPEP